MPCFRAVFRARAYPRRFFEPGQARVPLQAEKHLDLVDGLRNIPSVKVCWIDARERTVNGLLPADFFDFS
jgi:hypothetical protein